jgi:hypothetical protein
VFFWAVLSEMLTAGEVSEEWVESVGELVSQRTAAIQSL